MADYVIVGLGNPGPEYVDTRHNAGFKVIDQLAQECRATYWKTECGALTAKGRMGSLEVVLAKPQSYMNTSGGPVKQLLKAYSVEPDHLIVVHDEMDIDPGTVRVKLGGGHAGHNGLRSICDKLGTRDWYRVRIGIGKPPGRMQGADFVLGKLKGDDAIAFAQAVDLGQQAAVSLMEQGLEKTQNRFNHTAKASEEDKWGLHAADSA